MFRNHSLFGPFIALVLMSTHTLYSQPNSVLSQLERELIELVQIVKPSVVTVSANVHYQVDTDKTSFFSFKSDKHSDHVVNMTNIGSGLIVDPSHILTRASVVNGSDSITVKLYDGTQIPAKLVGLEADLGFAILGIDYPGLVPVKTNTQTDMTAGCWVTLVGNAMGVSPAVSVGVINGVRQDGLVQVSTNVSAGSIGSPLFNTKGEWVGIIAAKITSFDESLFANTLVFGDAGALAFPAKVVMNSINRIIQSSSQERGWMGVMASDVQDKQGWVSVRNIEADSPAEKAGLHVGDVIYKVDEKNLKNALDLADYIKDHQPGDQVTVHVQRKDTTLTLLVPLGNPPSQPAASSPSLPSFNIATRNHLQSAAATTQVDSDFILKRIRQMQKELNMLKKMVK